MLDLAPQFPRIARAVGLIAADAGDHLLRFYGASEKSFGQLVELRFECAAGGMRADQLEDVETYLSRLNENELETLCIGDQDEARDLEPPAEVDAFLLRVFEGLAADAFRERGLS